MDQVRLPTYADAAIVYRSDEVRMRLAPKEVQ